jgi:hypothetical protein
MLSQAFVAARSAIALCLSKQFVIGAKTGSLCRRMPEMPADGPAASIEATQPEIHQAHREFRVLAPPAYEFLIVAIGPHEVLAPNGQVASTDTAQICPHTDQRPGPAEGMFDSLDLTPPKRTPAVA